MTPLFAYRLRELDLEVEQLRAALAMLQRHLATRHMGVAAQPPAPQASPPRPGADEYLRAYT